MTTVAELPAGFADKVLSAQIDLPFRDGCDGAPGQRPAHRGGIRRACRHDARHRRHRPDVVRPRHAGLARSVDVRDIGRRQMAQVSHQRAGDRGFRRSAALRSIGDARALPALDRFAFGSNEYPDRSTTVILQVESLTQGPTFELRGPGIDGTAVLRATLQPADLFERLAINATLFPRGIDVVLVADDAVVAIPRTTRLVAKGD